MGGTRSASTWAVLAGAILAVLAPVVCRASSVQTATGRPEGQTGISIKGTLQGYFLTPQGQLGPRTVTLVERAAKPRESAHPVPSGYYLSVAAKSPTSPIVRAEVLTLRKRRQLLSIRMQSPAAEVRLPKGEGAWLGVRPEDGLTFRVVLHLADGRAVERRLHPDGIRLLPVPPLRVNWLDFVRIEEARRMLRVVGDDVLPGFRADGVPFALLGEGGHCVLVDHPHPPRGFRHYNGPCPAVGRVYVGRMPPQGKDPSAGEVGGVHTAMLPYDPAWFSLPAAMVSKRDERDAAWRFEAVLHEACHVVWMRRVKEDPSSEKMEISPRAAAIEEAEIDVLRETVEHMGRDREKLLALARDYLALRECRRAVEPRSPTTELREANEGLAYFAAWQAAEAARGRYDPVLLRRADPFLEALRIEDPVIRLDPEVRGTGLPELHLSQYLFYQGACQAELLHTLDPKALAAAWQEGVLLWRALGQVTGYDKIPAGERSRLIQEALARWQCGERETALREMLRQAESDQWRAAVSARQGQGVVLRVRLELLPGSPASSAGAPPWRFAPAYAFSTSGFALRCSQRCLVRSVLAEKEGWIELQTVLPRDGFLTLHRDGRSTRLQAGEVVIQAEQVRLVGGPSSSLMLIDCRRSTGAACQRGWKDEAMAVGLAVAPLPPTMGTIPEDGQLSFHRVTATVKGLFLNADTGQQQSRVLDVLTEGERPTGDWYYVAGERYTATAGVPSPSHSNISGVSLHGPDGAPIGRAAGDSPTGTLTVGGPFTVAADLKVSWRVEAKHDSTGKWACSVLGEANAPPLQANWGTGVVCVVDGSRANSRLEGAIVAVWPEGHPQRKRTKVTDAQGVATFTDLAPGKYLVEARADRCCVVRRGPLRVLLRGKLQTAIQLWPHCGIEGRVLFRNRVGRVVPGEPNAVRVQLCEGDALHSDLKVSTQRNPDGSYSYYGSAEGLRAGRYTIKATSRLGTPAVQERPMTIRDDCGKAWATTLGGDTAISAGPHSPVAGPSFTFTVETVEPPPEG